MPLQIDGATVGEVRHARPDGTLTTIGEARVWDDGRWKTVYESWRPRTVTIKATGSFINTEWDTGSVSGDTSLIQSLSSSGISFVEKTVHDGNLSSSFTDNTIPALTTVSPLRGNGGQTYTFTSVR